MSRYSDRIPDPKCTHKRKGIVTSGSLERGYTGPLASHSVCDRAACISDVKEWAYAMTHIEPTVLMDVDNPRHRNYQGNRTDVPVQLQLVES